jgi:trans-aconitate 2-methyltransferase
VWDPERYATFQAERSRPFFDLLALVRPQPGMRVVDLGCGSGELTRAAHERLQARETLGVDSSAAMLARARPLEGGGLRFEQADIASWEGRDLDLVLSNAALHWVPDHPALLARLTRALAPGGQLAVQVPANHGHVSHRLAHEIAAEPPFAAALGGYVHRTSVLEPEAYAAALFRLGYAEQDVSLKVYAHPLPSREAVVDWVSGTLLTDYEKRLDPERYAAFLARYRERLAAALPDERPFLYTYRRILFRARR